MFIMLLTSTGTTQARHPVVNSLVVGINSTESVALLPYHATVMSLLKTSTFAQYTPRLRVIAASDDNINN